TYSRLVFISRRRRHTRSKRDWSSDVCSSDLDNPEDSTSNVDFKSASKNMYDEADDGVDLSTGNNALMNDLLGNGAIDGDDNDKGQDKGKGDDNDDMPDLPPNPDPDKPSSNNGGASQKPQSSTPDSDGTNKADASS